MALALGCYSAVEMETIPVSAPARKVILQQRLKSTAAAGPGSAKESLPVQANVSPLSFTMNHQWLFTPDFTPEFYEVQHRKLWEDQ